MSLLGSIKREVYVTSFQGNFVAQEFEEKIAEKENRQIHFYLSATDGGDKLERRKLIWVDIFFL
jgi:hypothetical protein